MNNSHIMAHERASPRRFTRSDPCPVCGGHDGLVRGKSIRCFGYYDHSRGYARCTREERAGGLPQNRDGTYSHRLHCLCRCGQAHGDASQADNSRPTGAPHSQRRQQRQRFRSYFTLRSFLRKRYGDDAAVTPWVYDDATGREAFRVLRIDYRAPDGSRVKSYRPCHQGDDRGWRLSAPPGLLPLYHLPAILAAPPEAILAVLEGEKCADIAASLGLPCVTTSAHGAQAPWLSDWSPLAGRSVVILCDEGEKGAQYAAKVADLLAAIDTPADVRIVSLPGLSDGEDIEQFAAARRSAGCSDVEILDDLLALIEAARTCGNPAAIA